jgi:hypothetical protein
MTTLERIPPGLAIPDLQARPEPDPRSRRLAALPSSKVCSRHLDRLALVYVRQSSARQVMGNRESTQLQYRLRDRAVALGWPETQVLVIDDDLGQSGQSVAGRPGFQRLLAEVGLDHVGLVLGIEMSRLARCCRDWHQLLELCAVFGTLLGDADGVSDPTDPRKRVAGRRGSGRAWAAPADWDVLLRDRLPAYISWEQYEANQRQLRDNSPKFGRGTPRGGCSLLGGLVVCGRCGRRMGIAYADRARPRKPPAD